MTGSDVESEDSVDSSSSTTNVATDCTFTSSNMPPSRSDHTILSRHSSHETESSLKMTTSVETQKESVQHLAPDKPGGCIQQADSNNQLQRILHHTQGTDVSTRVHTDVSTRVHTDTSSKVSPKVAEVSTQVQVEASVKPEPLLSSVSSQTVAECETDNAILPHCKPGSSTKSIELERDVIQSETAIHITKTGAMSDDIVHDKQKSAIVPSASSLLKETSASRKSVPESSIPLPIQEDIPSEAILAALPIEPKLVTHVATNAESVSTSSSCISGDGKPVKPRRRKPTLASSSLATEEPIAPSKSKVRHDSHREIPSTQSRRQSGSPHVSVKRGAARPRDAEPEDYGMGPEIDVMSFREGQPLQLLIIEVETLWLFWAQPIKFNPDLDDLMDQLR